MTDTRDDAPPTGELVTGMPTDALRELQQERDHLLLLHEALAEVERASSMARRLRVFVDAIRRIGFGRVTLTLRDKGLNAREIVTAGLSEDEDVLLRESPVPGAVWRRRLLEIERFRVSGSYYLPGRDPWVAQEFGGVVINADSMQVYAELRILTARPTPHDEQRAPHWLNGHVPAREAYSAGRFVRDIHGALERARDADLRPILVGGTGLYFKALLEGLSPVPEIPVDIRQRWRDLEAEQGAYAMWSVLMQRDPEMALRLEPNDGQRIGGFHWR